MLAGVDALLFPFCWRTRTHNSSSNDAPIMIRTNYSGRSMLLLTENSSVDSSQKQCVATADVMRTAEGE